jgi:hypothetical protein
MHLNTHAEEPFRGAHDLVGTPLQQSGCMHHLGRHHCPCPAVVTTCAAITPVTHKLCTCNTVLGSDILSHTLITVPTCMMHVDNVPGDTPLTGDCHTKLPDGHDKCMKMQVNTKSTSATLLTVNTLPGALHPAYTHEHTTIYMGVYVPDHRNQQAMVLCPKAVCASQRQHATMLPLEAPHLAGRTSVTVHTLRAAQGGHKNNTAGYSTV